MQKIGLSSSQELIHMPWLNYSSTYSIIMSCFTSLCQDLRKQNLGLLLEGSNKYRVVAFKIILLVCYGG